MHEISVAHGILERALRAADEYGAERIDELTLEIGRATHVNPDQLVFCLEAILADTPADGATIRTETVDPIATCDCGFRDEPDELALAAGFAPDVRCPNCGGRAELEQGRECRLASIDVPDLADASPSGESDTLPENRPPQSQ
ncbi:MAG: hydrogenase maturation nickel metallochaperone HypA [Halodesulfurarchaeum sp.]|nr:hydrogenase maturation nickel metallochaperone HypA [Halodesulfurarchaeum sp.]